MTVFEPMVVESSRTARWAQRLKFGAVGAAGFVVDMATFNALRLPDPGLLDHKPVTARVIAVTVATLVTYAGNRLWTWRGRSRASVHSEYAMFFLLNGVGMLVTMSCLGISHYLLGFHSAMADNVSAFAIGVPLGTLFRYWSYQRFVFKLQP